MIHYQGNWQGSGRGKGQGHWGGLVIEKGRSVMGGGDRWKIDPSMAALHPRGIERIDQ